MLGRTASNLFWLSRYIERAENIARLTEVGYRISMTPDTGSGHREDWKSTLIAAGCLDSFMKRHQTITAEKVQNFLLFDPENPSSVRCCLETARNNGRAVRTGLTREMWEALNSTWIEFAGIKPGTLDSGKLPDFLDWIRQRSNMFRGALLGTLLRDEGYFFAQLGAFVERADNTARILDVKYYVLLPSHEMIGGGLDVYQWETILRSVSAHRSYRHVYKDSYKPWNVAEFLILRPEMPRSLRFSYDWIERSLNGLKSINPAGEQARRQCALVLADLQNNSMDTIFQNGLHEFLSQFMQRNNQISASVASEYYFQ